VPDAPSAGAPSAGAAGVSTPDAGVLNRPLPAEPWWRPAVDAVVERVPRSPRGIAALVLAAVVVAVVVAVSVRPAGAPTGRIEDSLPRATPARSSRAAAGASTAPADPTTDELVVHVAGAVNHPGVHTVKPGSRIVDAIAAAGGAAPDAEVDLLDLAAKVSDGQRIYVPRQGDDPALAGGGGDDGGNGSGPVNVNLASADELDALPGVGPSLAAAIIEYRQRHGPFSSVDQLLDVPGIGESKLASLRPKVTT
jgi:competence protein ComEA